MKLLKDWFAVPEGEIYPRLYPAGTELFGELLDRARALGLVADDDLAPKTRKGREAK